MSLRNPASKASPNKHRDGRPAGRGARARRPSPPRARDHARTGVPAVPTEALDVPFDDDATLQTGLLDDEFDLDDPHVALRTTITLAIRLLHEERDQYRFG